MKYQWIAIALILLSLLGAAGRVGPRIKDNLLPNSSIEEIPSSKSLTALRTISQGPSVRLLADFEEGKTVPFMGSGAQTIEAVRDHATQGKFALRLQNG